MTQGGGARILVVEDDPGILRALKTNLSRHGFEVDTAETGGDAIDSFALRPPDLILLDLGLPDIDGTDVIREVRARAATPIVILSVRGGERDKVSALDLGADDYLTKPFGVEELLARVRVALRHAAHPASGAMALFKSGDLEIDVPRRRVSVAGEEVHLTPTEYDLLKALAAQPDKVLTDRMLLQAVWGPEYGSEAHYLHVYVARLRRKIEADPQRPRHLLTEPGVGYRLVTE
ncbi:MAG: response regulator transcription factor [Dehalococcoidia bacterium]|jgi:two-component system KDP operon response regulator KdpE